MTITALAPGIAARVRFFEQAGTLLRAATMGSPACMATRQRHAPVPPRPTQLANTAPVPLPHLLRPQMQSAAGTLPRPTLIPRSLQAVSAVQSQPRTPAARPVSQRAEIAQMDLADLIRARDTLHADLYGGAYVGQPYAALHAQQTMHALALEVIRRPGCWNDGAADLVPQVVTQTDMWPAGRSLRIIDCANDAIFLFGPNGAQSHYGKSPDLLPEPAADEIVVMRLASEGGGYHYVRVCPDGDTLVRDVPADGDCFYSCLADGMGITEEDRVAFNLRFRNAVAHHISQSRELMLLACVPDPR